MQVMTIYNPEPQLVPVAELGYWQQYPEVFAETAAQKAVVISCSRCRSIDAAHAAWRQVAADDPARGAVAAVVAAFAAGKPVERLNLLFPPGYMAEQLGRVAAGELWAINGLLFVCGADDRAALKAALYAAVGFTPPAV